MNTPGAALRTCKKIIFHFWLAVALAGGVSKIPNNPELYKGEYTRFESGAYYHLIVSGGFMPQPF